MDKKRVNVVTKVLDNVKIKYWERVEYIEKNMKEVHDNERISMEEVFHFVVLLFLRFYVYRWSTFSCPSCFALVYK